MNLNIPTILNNYLIKINLKHKILTILKKTQNKALTLPAMRVIFKKEAVSGNIKIENWQKAK